MNKIYLFGFILSFTLASGENLDIKTWQLDSGMQVAFVEEHNKIVNIEIAFDAGASRDSDHYGIANLTSSLIDMGADDMNAQDIAESFENVGAIFGASTYKDFSSLSLQTLAQKEYFTPATKTFTKIISEPSFPADEIARAKDQVITAIGIADENPQTVATKKFFTSIYKDHPYGHASSGTKESVNAITKADIEDFYHSHYTSANASLVIVGDLSQQEAEKLAGSIDSALAKGTKLEPLPKAIPNEPGKYHIQYPSAQSSVVFGHVAISPNDPDQYALGLAGYILGGTMDSRLHKVIREEKGLVYGVSSYFATLRAGGAFIVSLKTKAETTSEATEATTPVIAEFIAGGVSETELATAKNVITTSYFDTFTTNSKIAGALISQMIYKRPTDYLNNYAKNIRAVTLDDINAAIKKHILPKSNAYVTVGPK